MSYAGAAVARQSKPATIVIEVVIEGNSDEGYHAYSPNLPGIHIDGNSRDEALARAKDAAGLYLESLVKHRDPLPPLQRMEIPEDATVERVTLEWPSLQMSGTR